MKQLLRIFLIISLTACFITGCRQPVGGVGGIDSDDGEDPNLNFMWLTPTRLLYETEERFDRNNDLQIMVVEKGAVRSVSPSDPDIVIEIIENPGLLSENKTVVTNGYHPFSLPGTHLVQVTYAKKFSGKYYIEVRGTFSSPGAGSGFINIIWANGD